MMDLTCEERPADSPFIERIWRCRAEDGGSFISIAASRWEMVVTRYRGKTVLTVRGPETYATPAYCPADAEFFGIQFKPGAFMPNLPPGMVMNRCDVNLPEATNRSFWLNGSAWQFPDYGNAEVFVDRLFHDGLLVSDPVIDAVSQGQSVDMSLRTVQRRWLQATGLTYGTLNQIERARNATMLIKQGVSILDTVGLAGYADQPHMTRAFRRFIGQTPAQIANVNRLEKLSFLFSTSPL